MHGPGRRIPAVGSSCTAAAGSWEQERIAVVGSLAVAVGSLAVAVGSLVAEGNPWVAVHIH